MLILFYLFYLVLLISYLVFFNFTLFYFIFILFTVKTTALQRLLTPPLGLRKHSLGLYQLTELGGKHFYFVSLIKDTQYFFTCCLITKCMWFYDRLYSSILYINQYYFYRYSFNLPSLPLHCTWSVPCPFEAGSGRKLLLLCRRLLLMFLEERKNTTGSLWQRSAKILHTATFDTWAVVKNYKLLLE